MYKEKVNCWALWWCDMCLERARLKEHNVFDQNKKTYSTQQRTSFSFGPTNRVGTLSLSLPVFLFRCEFLPLRLLARELLTYVRVFARACACGSIYTLWIAVTNITCTKVIARWWWWWRRRCELSSCVYLRLPIFHLISRAHKKIYGRQRRSACVCGAFKSRWTFSFRLFWFALSLGCKCSQEPLTWLPTVCLPSQNRIRKNLIKTNFR